MSFGKSKDDREALQPVVAGASVSAPEVFLGKGSKITGTLSFSGAADIEGVVEGEILSQDRLTIGETAVVNARINGAEIVVKGQVTGDIVASRRLSLRKPARVIGNISCAVLSVEEGVVLEGKCTMTSAKSAEVKPAVRGQAEKGSQAEKAA